MAQHLPVGGVLLAERDRNLGGDRRQAGQVAQGPVLHRTHDLVSLLNAAPRDQPARRFRQADAQHDPNERQERADPVHDTPAMAGKPWQPADALDRRLSKGQAIHRDIGPIPRPR
jgi:hypothetical protein